MYTNLGLYRDFCNNLPDDIEQLCTLQRMQTIHPSAFKYDKEIRNKKDTFFGDMTQIPIDRLNNEEDLLPTALSMFSELLRRNKNYTVLRKAKDKIHVACRGNSLMLAATLKSKGIPARVRVGFARYHHPKIWDDQWNVEYYKFDLGQWILVDSNLIGEKSPVAKLATNLPRKEYLLAPESWLGLRNKTLPSDITIFDNGGCKSIKAAAIDLLNDFNCLMNNEISFMITPKHLFEYKNEKYNIRDLNEKELKELDELATLMLDCDKNHEILKEIFEKKLEYKVLLGITVWND